MSDTNLVSVDVQTLEVWQKDVLHRLLIEKDASGLNRDQLFWFNQWLCERYGLDPWGVPVKYLPQTTWDAVKRQRVHKLVPYFGKECAEQLRCKRGVSITDLEVIPPPDPTLYLVKAHAKLPDCREDTATGCVSLVKSEWDREAKRYSTPVSLQGEELSNAIMKCETKAKNRVTFSILGMGYFMDQTEAESLVTDVSTIETVDTVTGEVKTNPEAALQTSPLPSSSPHSAPPKVAAATPSRPSSKSVLLQQAKRFELRHRYAKLSDEARAVGLKPLEIHSNSTTDEIIEAGKALRELVEDVKRQPIPAASVEAPCDDVSKMMEECPF